MKERVAAGGEEERGGREDGREGGREGERFLGFGEVELWSGSTIAGCQYQQGYAAINTPW
eukprot:2244994-Rhodomonas_salina.1